MQKESHHPQLESQNKKNERRQQKKGKKNKI